MNFLEFTDSNRFGQYSRNIFISFLSDILVVVSFGGELIRIQYYTDTVDKSINQSRPHRSCEQ